MNKEKIESSVPRETRATPNDPKLSDTRSEKASGPLPTQPACSLERMVRPLSVDALKDILWGVIENEATESFLKQSRRNGSGTYEETKVRLTKQLLRELSQKAIAEGTQYYV